MAMYQKLTRPKMRKLAPGRKLTENGICFERLAGGDGLYTVNIMVDRVRIHRVIGRESAGVTRTQCETFIEATRTAAREDRLALPTGRKVALPFTEAAKEYLEKLTEIGGKGVDRKKRQLDLHIKPFFRDRALSKNNVFRPRAL